MPELFIILIALPGLIVFIQFLVFLIDGKLPGKVFGSNVLHPALH